MKTFKRSSGIIVKNKDKFLFCKRSKDQSFEKKWSIPMGGIEKNESPIEAAHREFYEETNLKVEEPIELVGFINKFEKDNLTKRGIVYVYLLESDDENFVPDLENAKDGHEHSECGYFKIDEMPLDKKNEDLIKIIRKISK